MSPASASATASLSAPPSRAGAGSTARSNSEGLPRAGRFLFAPRSLPRAARAASRAGQLAQYSRKPVLHRGHGFDGRSTKRRTAATASPPLAIGWWLYEASRSACPARAESNTAPRSRAQVRQRDSTVSTGNINSVTTSSGGMPRSKRVNTLAAIAPAPSSDAEGSGRFMISPSAIGSPCSEKLSRLALNRVSSPRFLRAVTAPIGGLLLAKNALLPGALLELGHRRQERVLVGEFRCSQSTRKRGEAHRVEQDGSSQALPVLEQALDLLRGHPKLSDNSHHIGAVPKSRERRRGERAVSALVDR